MPAKTAKTAIRMEGLTLAVKDVKRSIEFYGKTLGLSVEMNSAPDFAMIRVGGEGGGTIGLLAARHANLKGVKSATRAQHASIHVELSTDDLDGLYRRLTAKGVHFHEPPHDEAWERSMQTYDPDGYTVEIAQGRRGHNQPKPKQAGACKRGDASEFEVRSRAMAKVCQAPRLALSAPAVFARPERAGGRSRRPCPCGVAAIPRHSAGRDPGTVVADFVSAADGDFPMNTPSVSQAGAQIAAQQSLQRLHATPVIPSQQQTGADGLPNTPKLDPTERGDSRPDDGERRTRATF